MKWLAIANNVMLIGAMCVSKSRFSSLSSYKLPRLYLSDTVISLNNPISLSDENAHYIKNVMRLKLGSHIRIFNPSSGEYISIVQQLGRGKRDDVLIEPISQCRPPATTHCSDQYPIKLYFAPIKKDKVKLLVEKCTELGVKSFCPVITQNTQHADSIDTTSVQDSLHHVLIQSVEQCERLSVPTITPSITLSVLIESLKTTPNTICFVCRERSDRNIIPSLLQALTTQLPSNITANLQIPQIALLVGPEGGFTEQEFELLRPYVHFVSLGRNVLRAETATIAAISMVAGWFDMVYK